MNLRKLLLGTTIALAPGLAFAADLPSRMAPLPVMTAVPFSWTGFYGGFNVGYGVLYTKTTQTGSGGGDSDGFGSSGSGEGSSAGTQHANGGGFLGGVQFGYNQQLSSNIVAGIETDLDLGNIKAHSSMAGSAGGSSSGYIDSSGGGTTTTHVSSQMTAFGTLRGRLGIAVDKTLIYATGGLAFANIKDSVSFNVNTPYWAGGTTATMDGWKLGWTAGAGVEYALTDKISVKAEGLYYDLGKKNFSSGNDNSTFGYDGGSSQSGSISHTGFVARIGLNFHL